VSGKDIKRPNPVDTRRERMGYRLTRKLDGSLASKTGAVYERDPRTGQLRRVRAEA
jgi:hypothetical protein